MPRLERKRKAAADERATANAARAKLEVDVADLEEQIERHAQTQAGLSQLSCRLDAWLDAWPDSGVGL